MKISDFPEPSNTAVAEHLYRQIDHMNKFDIPGLCSWIKAAGHLCGEILLSAPRPSGGFNVLLADFIGHGLPAAVGALPVAEVFFEMTAKGFGLSDVIDEINNKVLFVLPENLFCAACLIELDEEGKMLAVWNGGLPDVLIIDGNGTIKQRVTSTHPPLGKQEFTKPDLDTAFIDVTDGDRIYLCSDGLSTCLNQQGQQFGEQKLESLLSETCSLTTMVETLNRFMGETVQSDDMTLVQLDIAEIHEHDVTALNESKQKSLPPAEWQADFKFSAQVLKTVNIVPILVDILMHVQAPREHKQRIYTVIAEMCSNALDHGLLKLDSSLKASVNGFAEYYALRAQRLEALDDGYVSVSFRHDKNDQGGQLTIVVEDSGEGFDYQQHAKNMAENSSAYGRGESLLAQLCEHYAFSGAGNTVTAEYHWRV